MQLPCQHADSLVSLDWKLARAACPQAARFHSSLGSNSKPHRSLSSSHTQSIILLGYLGIWVCFPSCPCPSNPVSAFTCRYFHQTALRCSLNPAVSGERGMSSALRTSEKNLLQTLSVPCCEGSSYFPSLSGSSSPLPL